MVRREVHAFGLGTVLAAFTVVLGACGGGGEVPTATPRPSLMADVVGYKGSGTPVPILATGLFGCVGEEVLLGFALVGEAGRPELLRDWAETVVVDARGEVRGEARTVAGGAQSVVFAEAACLGGYIVGAERYAVPIE